MCVWGGGGGGVCSYLDMLKVIPILCGMCLMDDTFLTLVLCAIYRSALIKLLKYTQEHKFSKK